MLDLNIERPKNKYLSNYNKCCDGPYVDISKLHRALNTIGMFDTPYNRSILENGAIDIIYYISNFKITFNFIVTGWNMIDTESTDEDDGYCVNVKLNSITRQWEDYQPNYNYDVKYSVRNYEWFIGRTMWMVKDLPFVTDLIMDYEFCGNKHNLPDRWYEDLEFIKKLFIERANLNELKKDFD